MPDPQEFRAALGLFATGVTIVTARTADGVPVGLTANSFNSVSLNPPLVLWSLRSAALSMPAFARGSHYAIHILAAEQLELARRFATPGIDRFAGLAFELGSGRRAADPRLRGALRMRESQPVRGGRPRHLRRRGGTQPPPSGRAAADLSRRALLHTELPL
jgi:flavin reductase (DIM6/NTAB) family NADH-FMN oxidoreductase RutF